MQIEKLENVIEAILFASGSGIALSELVDSLGLQKSELTKAVNALKEKYGGNSGVRLISFGGKIQFGTNPEYADSVMQVLSPIKERELSAATLETIAIIAYRQPVTRLEIEQIRGVNCDYAVQVLLKHNLIEAVGRKDVVGKPVLFGTTDEFLKRFQVSSLAELPDYEQLLENIKVLSDKHAASVVPEAKGLYNEFEIPEEAEGEVAPALAAKPAAEDVISDDSGNLARPQPATDGLPAAPQNADAQAEIAAAADESQAKADDAFSDEEIPDFLKDEKDLQKIG